ncbi:membrane protein [Malaciobacter pacificus]|uniref:Outer membrane lipoprotein Blc n=1 Tax=Malaciobacter pacificus TaxID=1080223 RepID=A0A5C2HAG9_9BACT|nr:lipocalin family protein [Malaciobacter pacificus]QEP34166.1 lipocalin domain-containing protein [Malaciobacter pacificus]GGD42911.1 membrane protein [Malaciobacter pacificus]
MKTLFKILLPLSFIFLFTACSSKYPTLPTTKSVDINKYLGKWYEVARYEHFFEKGCKNVTATYSLREDGDINVINRCTKIKTGEKTQANGIAYATNDENTKLKVSFFRPFWGDYWVLMLDEDYKYAVVGTPSREYLWILSRSSTISEELKTEILSKLPSLGFVTNKLIWTIQD